MDYVSINEFNHGWKFFTKKIEQTNTDRVVVDLSPGHFPRNDYKLQIRFWTQFIDYEK